MAKSFILGLDYLKAMSCEEVAQICGQATTK